MREMGVNKYTPNYLKRTTLIGFMTLQKHSRKGITKDYTELSKNILQQANFSCIFNLNYLLQIIEFLHIIDTFQKHL